MTEYIEFATPPTYSWVSNFAFGNPVHNNVTPPACIDVAGVRVNGDVVDFEDKELPDKIHRALYEADKLRERRIAVDCLAFVALIHGEDLSSVPDGSTMTFPATTRNWYNPSDGPSQSPLYLLDGAMDYVHALHPAHTPTEEAYIQKLGSGPVILSSYWDALAMYKAGGADVMPTVLYDEPRPIVHF